MCSGRRCVYLVHRYCPVTPDASCAILLAPVLARQQFVPFSVNESLMKRKNSFRLYVAPVREVFEEVVFVTITVGQPDVSHVGPRASRSRGGGMSGC